MKPILIAVLAGLCWGIGEVFTKLVLHTEKIGPVTAIAVRSTVALPVIWLAYAAMVHGLKTEPRDWLQAESPILLKLILGSGLIAGAAAMILFYIALSMGEISRIKPVAFTVAPATAVLLGWLVLGEPLTPRKLIAICLVLTGVVLLTGK